MIVTYREFNLKHDTDTMLCGGNDYYQSQLQSSFATTIRLLQQNSSPNASADPRLLALARQVNDFFEPKAKALLLAKKAELVSQNHADVAARLEVTALFTDDGIRLAFAQARERKEVAPAPRKSLTRRILGPLYPNRRYWVMPQTEQAGPPRITTVRWPWAFWAIVLIGLLAGTTTFAMK